MFYEALFKIVFQQGFEPKEEDFHEFTGKHYEKYHREMGETTEKMYMMLRPDYRYLPEDEVMAVTETEKNSLLKAAQMIEKYCAESEQKFNTYQDKLRYAAKRLPEVFSEGTKFARSISTAPLEDTKSKKF